MGELDGLARPGSHPLLHRAAEIERERDEALAELSELRKATERYWQALIDISGYESWEGWPNQNEIARRALEPALKGET